MANKAYGGAARGVATGGARGGPAPPLGETGGAGPPTPHRTPGDNLQKEKKYRGEKRRKSDEKAGIGTYLCHFDEKNPIFSCAPMARRKKLNFFVRMAYMPSCLLVRLSPLFSSIFLLFL